MLYVLDSLQAAADARQPPERWLLDRDAEQDYRDCVRFAAQQREQLLCLLRSQERALFERFADNTAEVGELNRRIAFHQGLSIGLGLAALARR